LLNSYRRAYNLDFVAFRYFNACGADSRRRHGQKKGATHIIARTLESIKDNSEFVLNGDNYETSDGTCIRDYVHVEDIADAHVRAIDRSIPSDIYNLGTEHGASNRQIMSAVENITGKTLKHSVGPRREGDPAILTASPDKWISVGGNRPQFSLNDMIAHAWNWYNR
jgi:UDP-glucose 4-epimerase